MIDPVPVGYVGLDEALAQLAADNSDQEVYEERKRLKPAAAGELSLAELAWAKRELAITRLHIALRDGALIGFVRNPVSRELFRLTGTDWHSAAVFWREIIVGGIVRAAAGEEIERHEGRRVLLEASTLDVWLKKRMQRRPRAADNDCEAWLEAAMRASPERRPKPKDEWRKEAKEKFGLSGRAFDRLWAALLQSTGAKWGLSGAPSKLTQ
jgi:hypothetical protein